MAAAIEAAVAGALDGGATASALTLRRRPLPIGRCICPTLARRPPGAFRAVAARSGLRPVRAYTRTDYTCWLQRLALEKGRVGGVSACWVWHRVMNRNRLLLEVESKDRHVGWKFVYTTATPLSSFTRQNRRTGRPYSMRKKRAVSDGASSSAHGNCGIADRQLFVPRSEPAAFFC